MPEAASTRLGLQAHSGTDAIATIDDTTQAIVARLEAIGAAFQQGTSRPAASAALQGYFYINTSTTLVSYCTGSAWIDFQAYDSDLAALAALATTPFGRDLLTLADETAALAALTAAAIDDPRFPAGANIVNADIDTNAAIGVEKLGLDDHGLAAEAFSAYRATSPQAIPSGTLTKIQFNAERFDISGRFDSVTNYRVVPQVKGVVIFQARVTVALLAAGKFVNLWLYKNGAIEQLLDIRYSPAIDTDVHVAGEHAALCNGATDYFEVFVEHDHGSARDINNSSVATSFEGRLIGRLS